MKKIKSKKPLFNKQGHILCSKCGWYNNPNDIIINEPPTCKLCIIDEEEKED